MKEAVGHGHVNFECLFESRGYCKSLFFFIPMKVPSYENGVIESFFFVNIVCANQYFTKYMLLKIY